MSWRYRRVHSGVFFATAIVFSVQNANAAEPAATAESDQASQGLEEIVITGTFIRGAAPVGADVIGVSSADVQESGATTTSQLLETIPQMGSFNSYQGIPPSGFNNVTTSRPNLRNLPGFQTSGSSSTLLLLNGSRIVGMGIQSTSPDPDIVPPGLIERVEIVPDGGSAVYGSDAVAGVINFITKKNFEGVDVSAREGWASDYHSTDVSATAGHHWSGGSAYVGYNYSWNDAIFGADRSWVKMYPTTVSGIPFPVASLQCTPGNVTTIAPPAANAALPFTSGSAVPGTANQCDISKAYSIVPKEWRHSVLAGVSQELTDSIKLDVRAFYMNRVTQSNIGAELSTQYLGPAGIPIPGITPSPFLTSHLTSASPFEIQQVSFSYGGPHAGPASVSLNTWGVAPTLSIDLGHGWQLNTLASFGQSRTEAHTYEGTDSPALVNGIRSGLFNPYDPASSNPTALGAALDYELYGLAHQQLINVRSVADGDLFALPGGPVKVAAGVEYNRESLDSQKGPGIPGFENAGYGGLSIGSNLIIPPTSAIPTIDLARHVEAAFAEAVVPIFGQDNAFVGMKELSLSVAGRYDHYSDVGSTSNPKFGLTYKPLDWVKLRGAWGRSFVAPSLADRSEANVTEIIYAPLSALPSLGPPPGLIANGRYPAPGANQYFAILLGSKPGIQPQTAKTTSFGVDLDPPFIQNLHLSLTYWRIDYDKVIQIPTFTNQAVFWGSFGSFITTNPTQAQVTQAAGLAQLVQGAPCAPSPSCFYDIIDARTTNLGNYRADGLDLAQTYTYRTGFGSVDFGINANYDLDVLQSSIAGASYADLLSANYSRFRMRVTAGAQIGGLRAQASLDHTQGYSLNPFVGLPPVQTRVASFDVVDLFFKYDFDFKGAFKDLSATLNVNNVFDRSPPVYRLVATTPENDGYTNGFTLGRTVEVGVNKGF